MEELKSLFDGGSLSYDELISKCREQKIELANIGNGGYVSREKLNKEIAKTAELREQYTQLVNSTKDYETNMKELNTLRAEKENQGLIDKINGAKIDSKYAKFVLSEVKSQVNDENKFDDVLAKYVKENPQFLTTRTGVFSRGTSTPDLENGEQHTKSVNEQMNDIFRSYKEN